MNEHVLKSNRVKSGYNGKIIVKGVDITIPKNQISVIIGSNGCGKSTMLKTFCRLIKPEEGVVTLDDKSLGEISSKEVAKVVGLLPQTSQAPEGIKVIDLIARGRFPYRKLMSSMTKEDYNAVAEAMDFMGITDLADRSIDELSGGQRQRVLIALALAQKTDILFLDEPTTYLDIAYQIEILDLLKELNKKRKTTIVMVLHDINLSTRYADYIFAMKDGELIRQGTPTDVITVNNIKEIYGLDSEIICDPVSNSPYMIPRSRHD